MSVQLSRHQYQVITLWYLVQHSLASYHKLVNHFGHIDAVLDPKNLMQWSTLKIHKNHIERAREFQQPDSQAQFQTLIDIICHQCDFVCTTQDPHYPQQLLHYSDCPPILLGQGCADLLNTPQISIVGSRKASKAGMQISYDFSYFLAEAGFTITSGLASGVDQAAHDAALQHHRTIAVIATGIDTTYPKSNTSLKEQILRHKGAIVTEFLPFTPPLQHHFPRRNRIVSGLSLAVLVTQASLNSGSLITAKAAAEQGKLIFATPGHIYDAHYQGCHQLIRDGAILVDHPTQILEDIALPTHWHIEKNASQTELPQSSSDIPIHLSATYHALSWQGQDLDEIFAKTQIPTSTLLSNLMELELEGLCVQQFGLYFKHTLSSV
ncbi:DNA-protecting protein DprA [Acinetobacter sp. B5B]|uniref:DNA-processing protein DprA n=1 Tax=Acinetobacter baretiae TaxID=2605383 RepID=UPI0018C286C9|nr:DNA-processing protein DprA [Acinetobacter baretiae]MBF7684103.1 DNA-protecting protein DprA [Acinetobacter baretiae]